MRKLLYIAVLVALCCHAAHGANFQPSPTSTTWSAIKSTIDANFQKAANVQEENTFQKAQEFRVGITAPEYFSSAADGEIVARIYNTVAITAPPAEGAIAYLNDRYWLANGTNWTSLWLLDNSKIGVAGGVQGYSARLDTVVNMSGINKYTGTNALGEFGVHDLPSGGGPAYTLPPATALVLGGVKVGAGLSSTEDGTLSVNAPALATSSTVGVVKPGTNVSVTQDGTLNVADPSIASSSSPGVVKPGTGLSVTQDGTLSVALTGGSYLLTPPEYSDDPCTPGQYADNGSTTVYLCNSDGDWITLSGAVWNNPRPQAQPPTLTARNIQASGTALQVTGSRALKAGAGGPGGWSMSCTTAGVVGVTYSSGLPGTMLNFGLNKTILSDDTCTLNYTNPGSGILANDDDQALASFSGAAVTNGSQQSGGGGAPDYVPYEASFMFGTGDSVGENVKVCIAQTDGTLLGCSGAINRNSLNNQAGTVKATITGVAALAPGDYLLGVVPDGYIYYANDPNGDGWITQTSENSYTTPTNFSLPGTDQSDGYYCVQILNANGDVLLGIEDCTAYTAYYLGGSENSMTFWQFTRVALP